MSLDRRITGSGDVPAEPLGSSSGLHELRLTGRASKLADGTLACPVCDAPVAPLQSVASPADAMGCGFCLHEGALRDFLSLAAPTRPTRVTVHVRSSPQRRTASRPSF